MELKVLTVCAFLLVSLCSQFGDARVTCSDDKDGVSWYTFCRAKSNEKCQQQGYQAPACVCKLGTARVSGICTEMQCPFIYNTGGVVTSGDCRYAKLGAKCDFSCKKHHHLMEGNRTLDVNKITMQCVIPVSQYSDHGQWDRKLTCKSQGYCQSLQDVLKEPASVYVDGECRDAAVGDNCLIRCKEGFRPAPWWNLTATDIMNATCLPTQAWNLQISCHKNPPCPDLSAPNGGFAVGDCKGALFGQACYFGCFPGFHLKGQSMLRCQSGDWNESVPICAETKNMHISEEILPVQSSCDGQHPSAGVTWNDYCRRNGKVCVPSSDPEQVLCGDCIPGHQPGEDESQKCLEAVSCPDLFAPIGGLHLGECWGALNGQSCYFACYPGYNVTGRTTLRCQSGKWDGPAPTCTAADNCQGLKRSDGESWSPFCEKQPNRVCTKSTSGEPSCVCREGCREDNSGSCSCSPRRIHIQEFRSILIENRRRRQAEN